MSNSNAVRHTARFGARYGVSVKKRFESVEVKQRQQHVCPKCGFQKVSRVSTGIFSCGKCHAKYAGGAFYPQTLSGGIIAKMVEQRAFTPELTTELQVAAGHEEVPAEATELSDEEKIEQLTRGSEKKEKRKKKAAAEEAEEVPEEVQDDAEDEE